jgi:hypothetical protein
MDAGDAANVGLRGIALLWGSSMRLTPGRAEAST